MEISLPQSRTAAAENKSPDFLWKLIGLAAYRATSVSKYRNSNRFLRHTGDGQDAIRFFTSENLGSQKKSLNESARVDSSNFPVILVSKQDRLAWLHVATLALIETDLVL
jgi:hypothetical protein